MKIPEIYKELKELEVSLEKLRQDFATTEAKRKERLEELQSQCPHPKEMLETVVVENTESIPTVSLTCLFCKKENIPE